MNTIIAGIEKFINDHPLDDLAYSDMVAALHEAAKGGDTEAHAYNKQFRSKILNALRACDNALQMGKFDNIYKRSLLVDARVDLDAYLQYVEFDRDPKKKFYLPRRDILRPVVNDLQDLMDGVIDFLAVSLPTRVGKSTLCIFFLTMLMGRNPNVANVMSGHSDTLCRGFFSEVLNILTDTSIYNWQDVFPEVKIASTSAKDESIDLDHPKRFPTLTCRSIGGTLTGAVEVGEGGLLYVDDLIEDLEESLNPDRLQKKYDAYLNQLVDRKKEGSKELMVGTRWNVYDPIGRVKEQYGDNPRYRFTVIPALNEQGESNFHYHYGVGFSTAYFNDIKAKIDEDTFFAKYQGDPRIRGGLLFPEKELRFYNGVLPDGDHAVVMVTDIAWGGGDSLASVFAYVYGSEVYVHDVIFNKGDKEITRPIVVGRMAHHMPYKARFEANNGGDEYADKVDEKLREKGVHINIFSIKAPTNQSKEARIIQYAPDIKKWYFIGEKHRNPEYAAFMREVCSYTQMGKNPHDDAPDVLAMLADELTGGMVKVEFFKRPF